jgi:hypothetical protein
MASQPLKDSSASAMYYRVLRQGVDVTRVQRARTCSAHLMYDLRFLRLSKEAWIRECPFWCPA